MGIAAVALCQFFCQSRSVFLIHRRIGAGIVPLSEFMMPSFIIGPGCLRIALYHPCRQGGSGCRQNNVIIFPAQHIDYFIQFRKIIGLLGRLDLCPGEYVDCGAVDPCVFKVFHILFPDGLFPLVGIVIAAV